MRGIAINFPEGLKALRIQLDALDPPVVRSPDEALTRFQLPPLVVPETIVPQWLAPATEPATVSAGADSTARWEPNQPKKKGGRPRKNPDDPKWQGR